MKNTANVFKKYMRSSVWCSRNSLNQANFICQSSFMVRRKRIQKAMDR